MDKQKLFLYTLEDLKSKLDSNNSYQVLKTSELVRTLLFDTSGPLADKINREFKLKIKFHHKDTMSGYNILAGIAKPSLYLSLDGFYPKSAMTNSKTVESNKSEFFKTMVIVVNEREFTVKEILDHAVNCLGGTHHGEPKEAERIALKELESLKLGDLDTNSIIRQTKSIGYVVLDALQELKEKVIEKYYS
jgi:hypothetical protein